MKKLFDPSQYPLPDSSGCASCGSNGSTWTKELSATFFEMVGHAWIGPHLTSYALGKDLKTLGLEVNNPPERVDLCIRCAIDYMRNFNDLLRKVKEEK